MKSTITTQVLIGSLLAMIRENREITQQQLAISIGVSKSAISRRELGLCDIPAVQLMDTLLELDFSVPAFFCVVNSAIQHATGDGFGIELTGKAAIAKIRRSRTVMTELNMYLSDSYRIKS